MYEGVEEIALLEGVDEAEHLSQRELPSSGAQ